MKKLLNFGLVLVMAAAFVGCSGNGSKPENRAPSLSAEQSTVNTEGQQKVLIVYYSYSGKTKSVSERLQKKTGGDIFELIPVEPYGGMYEASDRAKEEIASGNLPSLSGNLPDVTGYDIVIIGGPVWSSTVPPPVMTFLAQTDFKGKAVAPFWTYDGNEGHYDADIRKQVKNGSLRKGLGLSYVNSYEEAEMNSELDAWLKTVGAASSGRK